MGLEALVRARLRAALLELSEAGKLERTLVDASFNVEPPPRGGAGHVATNAALVLAKRAGLAPRGLAESLAESLRRESWIAAVDVAGPGFVNVTCAPAAFHETLREVARAQRAYGRRPAASRARVNVEFVSANPTGPLLISHGRGAVVGDAIARLLEVTGHRVTREYYVNDFGNQVHLLGLSVVAAHRGEPPPEGGYGGFYVAELASWLGRERSALLAEASAPAASRDATRRLASECVALMLEGIPGSDLKGIRPVLRELGVEFDVWTSEEGLHRTGRVARALDVLRAQGRLEERDGAVMFVSGDSDDKDRVVQKSDGEFTYFASDIAYHEDKFARGFERLVDVWGADHHGYIARVRNGVAALGRDGERFEVVLFQLVRLLRDGKPYKMGKRLGNLITIQEVVEEIDQAVGNPHAGRDALRFFYLARRFDTPIDLDVELAKQQRDANPVFYVQYGHARLCSVLRRAEERFGLGVPAYSESLAARIVHPMELELLAQLGRYPEVVLGAAEEREPHRLIGFLQELARAFQSYYTQQKLARDTVLPLPSHTEVAGWESAWDWELTRARLLWVDALRAVYRSGLELLGMDAHERMDRPVADAADEAGSGEQAD